MCVSLVALSGLGLSQSGSGLLSSSFLGLPSRILNINHKKELLRSLWVKWLRAPTAQEFEELHRPAFPAP